MSFPPTLLCGMLQDDREDCTIDFAAMMTQIPFEFKFDKLNVTFARSYVDVYNNFKNDPSIQCLICLPSNKSNLAFVKRAIQNKTKGCVVGIFPVPVMNWQSLANGRPATTYQIPPDAMGPVSADGYASLVKNAYNFTTTFPDIFALRKGGENDVYVDLWEPFNSTSKVEFAGCVKLRLAN